MPDPNDTPGAAITRAAARHKAASDATKALAAEVAEQRRGPSGNPNPPEQAPQP